MRSKVLLISMGKGKALKLRKQFGFYAWNAQCAGNMRSIIPNKNPKTAKQFGFYAWNVQCAGNMRSIILNKKTKTAKSLGAMLGMPNSHWIMN
jgi:hypothetical protein